MSVVRSEGELRLVGAGVELSFPTTHGPRVARFARTGAANVFGDVPPSAQAQKTPFGEDWHIYGGHRLWYAPEEDPRSYYPDNAPVAVSVSADELGVTLTQTLEPHTHLAKSIEVQLDPSTGLVAVTHRIRNGGAFPIELAPWALTVMAKGGRAIFPQVPYVPHPTVLAPARPLVLWPFTRMDDPRWTWGHRFIVLRQDETLAEAQKVGFFDPPSAGGAGGWMAYAWRGELFVKLHAPQGEPSGHADFGCNVETFTNDVILELETLGPLARLAAGATVQHREWWMLFGGVNVGDSQDAIAAAVEPLVARARAARDASTSSASH